MAKPENRKREDVNLSGSSAQGIWQAARESEDSVTENQIDRMETITGGDDEDPSVVPENLQRKFDALDASTEEELDALEVDLMQDRDPIGGRNSSGLIDDEIAEEQIAEFTEVGPAVSGRGAESVAPGNEDTSETLRRHHPSSPAADDSDAIVEGNIDQPLDDRRLGSA